MYNFNVKKTTTCNQLIFMIELLFKVNKIHINICT